ncbi:MAG: PTS IIA-like nitrogen regulatory protein PtsN [Gammaproteobacteria bacterium]|nr:PTS IIA-like nitrogen regulatory protein PtsN [Gammaproteobacteria bacterium]
MQIADLITPDRVACHVKASSKKRAFELLADMLAGCQPGLTQQDIVDSLMSRERLGSTGLGHGVAIPHGRIKKLHTALAAVVQLERGIDFDAIDNEPVDLLFALVVPEESTEEHLQLLAQLAEMLSDEQLRGRLHSAQTRDELCTAVACRQSPETSRAALR